MRQILYSSVRTGPDLRDDLAQILIVSRRNNALEGVTGVLWTDGTNFLQVLEGGDAAVEHVFDRIRSDPRHTDIKILVDEHVLHRSFSTWSMAFTGDPDARLERALGSASATVRSKFAEAAAGQL